VSVQPGRLRSGHPWINHRQLTSSGGSSSKPKKLYRQLSASARSRVVKRHDRRLSTLARLRRRLTLRLFAWIVAFVLVLVVAAAVITRSMPEVEQEAPSGLSTWMEQQKLLRQLAEVQQWLQDGQATSDQPPPSNLEELQAWLDQIELTPDLQTQTAQSGESGQGFVPFQCAAQPVDCPVEDVPQDDGEFRVELSRLVRNANIMLSDNGDCEGTVNLVREYGSLFGWRKSEAVTKARTELSVARCFMENDEPDKAGVHYRRTFCASVSNPDPDQAMNALYGLARLEYQAGNAQSVSNYVDCSESLLDYHLSQVTTVATLDHFITLALMHYEFLDDTREAIRLEEKALAMAQSMLSVADIVEHESYLNLMLILQLNLMEGYITIGDRPAMQVMYDQVSQNPLLLDSDRLVALGLLVMQDLVEANNDEALRNLDLIIQRYAALPEFAAVDQHITDIRQALSAPLSGESLQRLSRVRQAVQR